MVETPSGPLVKVILDFYKEALSHFHRWRWNHFHVKMKRSQSFRGNTSYNFSFFKSKNFPRLIKCLCDAELFSLRHPMIVVFLLCIRRFSLCNQFQHSGLQIILSSQSRGCLLIICEKQPIVQVSNLENYVPLVTIIVAQKIFTKYQIIH